MRFNQLLMGLIRKHTDIDSKDFEQLNHELDAKYALVHSDEQYCEENQLEWTWKNKLKHFAEHPYTRVGFVLMYWYLFRKIGDWKNGSDETDNEDDDKF